MLEFSKLECESTKVFLVGVAQKSCPLGKKREGVAMKAVLEVRDLEKSFQKSWFSKKQAVLQGLSFSLFKGEVTSFLGPNGSGKTTALKCILGLMSYDKGDICFSLGIGQAKSSGRISKEVLKKVGFLPEESCFYDYLTAEELLIFYGRLLTSLKLADLKLRVKKWLKELGIEGAKDQKLRTFSKGMGRRLGLAQALMGDPELLILDEPLAGLDVVSREQVGQFIKNYAKQGGTVFFSSHLFYDVGKIADKLVVLKGGKTFWTGPTQTLLHQAQYEIWYLDQEQKCRVIVDSLKACQKEIDRLRKGSLVILAVQQYKNLLFPRERQ